jgi:hypothetical protein
MFWGSIAHEPITPISYVGVAVVIAGLILMNRPGAPKIVAMEACSE